MDASTNNDSTINDGKGLIFPRTDLTQFTFKTANADGILFPTYFDGMVVYNSGTGNTVSGNGIVTSVTPGFYYFSNPNGAANQNLTTGQWLPLGQSPKVNIGTTETVTSTSINNAQVYAIRGSFTADGSTTSVNIPAPTGMTALYGITIFKAGTNSVYDRSLYSYTVATTPGNAITGSPNIAVVYPAGTYDYVLEYFK
ncbi:hypothetical protein [Chryseobacterium salviniae]|uniref:C1q domain-containing protein n=1 Tax=Chryseobacterium salviniae TaxID=3101750 RepID=A0ABU6HX06_9FLAO|nr:hypothetical protein [Chryseobacterium sp. T9W2-O]MEC3877595.1 hypothetical protein [Chryseobacterium sp. T9W2-O]